MLEVGRREAVRSFFARGTVIDGMPVSVVNAPNFLGISA
jgi:hypothetical protein